MHGNRTGTMQSPEGERKRGVEGRSRKVLVARKRKDRGNLGEDSARGRKEMERVRVG